MNKGTVSARQQRYRKLRFLPMLAAFTPLLFLPFTDNGLVFLVQCLSDSYT